MDTSFSVRQITRSSWKVLKSQIWILVGLLIGYTIISSLISCLMPSPTEVSAMMIVSIILSLLVGIVFSLGYYQNIFQTIDGEEPQFSTYASQSKNVGKGLIAGIIFGITVGIGTTLLILPGIYLALRLQFYTTAIVEGNMGAVESLKYSWKITKGKEWYLLKVALMSLLLVLVGMLFFFVGAFVTAPLVYVMSAQVYRQLVAADGTENI